MRSSRRVRRRRRRGRSTNDPLDAAHASGAYDPHRLVIVVRVPVRVRAHHVAQERGIRIPSPSSRRRQRRRVRRRRGKRRRRPRGGRRRRCVGEIARRCHARRTPAMMTTALVGGRLRVTRRRRRRRRRHDEGEGGSRLVDGWEGRRQRRAPRGGGFLRRRRLLLRAGRHGSGFGVRGVGANVVSENKRIYTFSLKFNRCESFHNEVEGILSNLVTTVT